MVKPTILVVDDEPSICETMCALLNELGFDAESAPDGQTALLKITADTMAVFSDVNMPNLNGFELALKVQQTWPHIKIFLMSGNPNNFHRVQLRKPFSLGQLSELLLQTA